MFPLDSYHKLFVNNAKFLLQNCLSFCSIATHFVCITLVQRGRYGNCQESSGEEAGKEGSSEESCSKESRSKESTGKESRSKESSASEKSCKLTFAGSTGQKALTTL
ncbi:MAG: hypothetical protein RMK00_06830 [Bacteroidota bacterium]|nr:hypothetical protein [Candidatus Kapabacteria bacterium]MCS7302771.1 hypothetical protein [Candidatus Kapabacteria bacterium]MDW8075470.1 hypothetical protein [Bacteroidota bacterium]